MTPSKTSHSAPIVALHLTTVHLANDTRIFDKECRSLSAAGYRVILAASGGAPNGFGVMHLPLRPPPSRRLTRFAAASIRGAAIASATEYDILHIHDPELLPVGIGVARSGRKVVWDAHEDYFSRFASQPTNSRHHRLGLPGPVESLLRRMDRVAAGVVAATPSIASSYRNPNVAIVGNEARMETFRDCQPNWGSRRILFIGTPSEYHMFPELVAAVEAVPLVTLAVAGRDTSSPAIHDARQRLHGRLQLLGWLAKDELAKAMSGSFLGAATLVDTPLAQDNSSNKVFEFAAAGLPPLVTPNPSNLAHARSGGHCYVAPDFSSRGLAIAIREALRSETAWTSKSEGGRSWAYRRGNWVQSEGKLLALYEAIVEKQSTSR